MKKTINLYEATVLDEMFENHRSLLYKLPTHISWELQQFFDIIKQMKRLWTETVTARVPSELLKSVKPEDVDATLVMMDDIADQTLSIITPSHDVMVVGRSMLSDEEYELLRPLWDLIERDS